MAKNSRQREEEAPLLPPSSPILKRGTGFYEAEEGFKAWNKDFPGSENPFRESYEAHVAAEEALTKPLSGGNDEVSLAGEAA